VVEKEASKEVRARWPTTLSPDSRLHSAPT
jgi:hypothetical protein